MKAISAIVIALGLVTASAAFDPFSGQHLPLQRSADSQQAMHLAQVDNFAPGECCNDDFRDALPLAETPIDSVVAKP